MEDKKYYHFKLEEINGEQEYSYDYLIEAASLSQAAEIAEAYAGSFYNDKPEIIDGGYIFFDGTIAVEVASVIETTKEDFVQNMLREKTITA